MLCTKWSLEKTFISSEWLHMTSSEAGSSATKPPMQIGKETLEAS